MTNLFLRLVNWVTEKIQTRSKIPGGIQQVRKKFSVGIIISKDQLKLVLYIVPVGWSVWVNQGSGLLNQD